MKMTTTTIAPPKAKAENKPAMRDPSLLADLRHDVEEMWQRPLEFLFEPFTRNLRRFNKTLTAWVPSVDVYENEGELLVKADLPGMKKADLEVTLEENDLVLRGERKMEKEVKDENLYRAECEYGTFYRRLALPFLADPKLILAEFKDGVLEVKIPIPAAAKPAAATINVA
jgi:HSP20 family protein